MYYDVITTRPYSMRNNTYESGHTAVYGGTSQSQDPSRHTNI